MLMQHSDINKNRKGGFVTLISVIILTSIALIIISSQLLISTDNYIANKRIMDSLQARVLADTCAELTLNRLKISNAYTGNDTEVLSFGTCNISTISGSGNTNRSFTTSATYNNTTRRVSVTVSEIDPVMTLSSWQETQ